MFFEAYLVCGADNPLDTVINQQRSDDRPKSLKPIRVPHAQVCVYLLYMCASLHL